MSKQRRRRIRPHEQARVDQTLAAAREHGANDPRTAVLVVTYADPGVQCCWCDCNPLEQHGVPGYRCAGCPREALYMVHTLVGTPERVNYPLCAPHHPDFLRFWRAALPVPVEPHLYDAYDADAGDAEEQQ